jgi:predicted anti-sigma-YlaC factor YlaD
VRCRDVIAILDDYLEGSLAGADLERLEAHLRECDECRAYLDTYRRTLALTRTAGRVEMPREMRRHLRALLISRLGVG